MYSVFGNQDLAGGYAALGLVLLFSRFLRNDVSPRVASFLGPVLLGALLLSGCRSAWLAALSGLIVAGAMGERTVSGRAAAVAMVGALALVTALCAVAPEATSQRVLTTLRAKDVGGRVRLWIWDGTLRMIGDRPWLGVGPGDYAYWSPWYMGAALHADKGRDLYYNERHAEHAHNEALELIAETGMIGVAFALWMLVRLIRAPGAHWAGMTALLVFGLFNAGFHSAPHGLAFVLLAGAGASGEVRARMNLEGRWVSCSMMVLAGILAAAFVSAVFIPSCLLRRAEDAHLANDNWEVAYEQVLQWPWPVWKAHEEYGIALYDAGRLEEAAARFEASLAGVDTGRPYLALGVIHCGWGRAETAEEYLRACLWRWPRNRRAWEYLLTVTPDHAKSDLISEAATWGIDLRMQ